MNLTTLKQKLVHGFGRGLTYLLVGKAGTGKSALALCAGLEAVLERRSHRKVVVFRPLYAVGGQYRRNM